MRPSILDLMSAAARAEYRLLGGADANAFAGAPEGTLIADSRSEHYFVILYCPQGVHPDYESDYFEFHGLSEPQWCVTLTAGRPL